MSYGYLMSYCSWRSALSPGVASLSPSVRSTAGSASSQIVEHVQLACIGTNRQQGDTELLVLMRGRHEFVAARMNAGRNTQHHASALAETLGDFGDAGRSFGSSDHDFGEVR